MNSIQDSRIQFCSWRMVAMIVMMISLCTAFAACHEESDDYYTTAQIEFTAPEGTSIKQLQGTVKLYNINNRQTFSTSAFNGNTASIEVFRGAYSVTAEGSLRYVDSRGREQTGSFRAVTDYCEVMEHPSRVVLKIILM